MARTNHGIEKGLTVFAENGDERFMLLQGTAAPDGVAGDQGNAPLSSLYFRSGTSEIYKKIANAGAPADWEQLGSGGTTIGNWRPERVDAHTGQVLSAGVTDPTAWSDNDGGADGNDFTVGHYVLDGNCDLFEVTVVTGASSITLAAAATPPATDDMFAVKYNLPDPAGQENQAIVTYDGTNCIKVADVDFATATGIVLSGAYAAATGDPAGGDSVELGIAKIDGNVDQLTSAVGVSQGDANMGTYTGNLLNDNESAKQNIQQLEDAAEGFPEIQTGVSASTVLDAVLVDQFRSCVWLVTAFDEASAADTKSFMVHGLNDGTAAADAANVTDDVFTSEKLNGNFNTNVSVVLNGTGATQEMRLQVNTTELNVTYTAVRMGCAPSGY